MSGWLAWVGATFVLVSVLLDDRRVLRHVNLVAALGALGFGLVTGVPVLIAVDALVVAAALAQSVSTRRQRPRATRLRMASGR